jgi:hypothetical protein
MRSEEEIRLLRNEIHNWVDTIYSMGDSLRDPRIIASLVIIHDVLDWTLQSLPRTTGIGLDFESTIDAFRVTLEEVKKKQDKHRNALAN